MKMNKIRQEILKWCSDIDRKGGKPLGYFYDKHKDFIGITDGFCVFIYKASENIFDVNNDKYFSIRHLEELFKLDADDVLLHDTKTIKELKNLTVHCFNKGEKTVYAQEKLLKLFDIDDGQFWQAERDDLGVIKITEEQEVVGVILPVRP